MSGYIPRWTPEMLEDYKRRMAACKHPVSPADLPVLKLPGKKPKFNPVGSPKLPAGLKIDPNELAQERTEKPLRAHGAKAPALVPYAPVESVAVPLRAVSGKQTKTEQKYNAEVLGGRGRFEAVTLHLPGGGRYTPDFMTLDDGVVTFHEVKGSYRLGSQGRAYTAFHDAAAYYPMWRFVWAHWTGKAWDCKTFSEMRI
jgi:hypothetical protein